MMTLDEAIAHAEWAANNCEGECSDEHRQLAEWLRELADEQRKVLLLMTEANSLRAENEKLRKYLKDTWESCTDCDEDMCSYSDAKCRDIGGTCWLYECIKGMGIEVE